MSLITAIPPHYSPKHFSYYFLNLFVCFIQMVMSSSESSSPDATSPRPCTDTALAVLVKGLPEMLLRQFEYEDPIVRGGKHLLHSAFFKELVLLSVACNIL
jgi:hypothetical protein